VTPGKGLDGDYLADKLPTGNGTQGGDFVDWFRVLPPGPKRRRRNRTRRILITVPLKASSKMKLIGPVNSNILVKEKTMSANTEKCADKDKTVCDYNEFRRLRYFHGMLLDDKDFQAEQQYHSGKRRLLNRMLHGSGVVCGLDLKGKQDGRWIEISAGLALDCSGNEIYVPKKQRIDLASLLPPKDRPKSADCIEVEDDDDTKTYYIGIRYEEKPTNPVSVYLPSGSCEEKTCENSRYKEGFCIEVVDCCPEKYSPGLFASFCGCEDGDQPDDADHLCG
jgi:hypothetical protein